ncbi:LysM peptidoglycan-binding domain-containing protein [Dyella acidiphila]|uniref:Lysozyme n=1 Tax=Dyella acidiphila TaxID=2775866 RepID=A0ABR9GA72_9GAMM|nr:LysM peptidoglycan-binding domain-containing protein [Dyella acidiphila]MBE1160899.1 LysM peptidoglycan-binding domain-containing protein [Dyella acidiphila]
MSTVSAVRLAASPANSNDASSSYTVQHGDTLAGIAAHFGVSLAALEAANPSINNPNLIYPGDQLTIPGDHTGNASASGSQSVSGGKGAAASSYSISENGVKMIEGFEGGPYLNAYPDPATGGAPWTIGYGHTGGVTPGEHITQAQAEQFLKSDLQSAENAVRNSIHVPITQNQFDACVSLAFNIGGSGFASSDVASRLNAGNYAGAQQAFGEYNHANGMVLPGLTRRRAAEAALFGSSAPSGSSSTSAPGKSNPGSSSSPSTGSSENNYTVRSGDTLSSIAASHGISLSTLEAANEQIANFNTIFPGEAIHLPGSQGATSSSSNYSVRAGDTLTGIAASHGVSLAALEAANPQIANPNVISVGETIHIPSGSTSSQPTAPKPASSNYVVRAGDTMSGIASSHGVSLSALEAANSQITNPNLIHIGETVHIPGGGAVTSPSAPGTVKGSNAAAMAQKYLGRYETDLEAHGITQAGVDPSESCANFVSSMLQQAGQINWHSINVGDLTSRLQQQGWHKVSLASAKPGDVWICHDINGEDHTEIVASNTNGHVTLIGSNNTPDPNNQQINYDNYSASIDGSYILAPP